MRTRRARNVELFLGACFLFLLAPAWAQDYTIGPKDVLKVIVWGQDDLSKEYPVDADGSVPFPFIGRAKAKDVRLAESVRCRSNSP